MKSVDVSVQNDEPILIRIIQLIQAKYTLDLLDENDEYHTDVIRSQLTRNIANTFKDVREELIMAMDDLIPTREDGAWQCPWRRGYISQHAEWIKVSILDTLQRVICRATNRVFVGAPLCPSSFSASLIL